MDLSRGRVIAFKAFATANGVGIHPTWVGARRLNHSEAPGVVVQETAPFAWFPLKSRRLVLQHSSTPSFHRTPESMTRF
jgi:hypothetical protein